MRKKLTILMVLVAAVLLATPTQAQTFAKKQARTAKMGGAHKALTTKELKQATAAYKKATTQLEGQAFRGYEAVTEAELAMLTPQAPETKEQAGEHVQYWNWGTHTTPAFVSKSGLVKANNRQLFGQLANARKVEQFNRFDGTANMARRAATQDAHGIITAPDEGEYKYYTRGGTAFYASGNSVYSEEQGGHVTMVDCGDGTVYIKDLISHYNQGSWVKGTKEDNTITVNVGQPLAYSANYNTTLSIYWGDTSGNTFTKDAATAAITFTIDGDVITLNGSSSSHIIGVFWDDDNSWQGYGDYETTWTLDNAYQPASTELIELPDGATPAEWYADGSGSAAVPTAVYVAFVGNDVYVSGLTSNFPDAWIKGTKQDGGNVYTFSALQFVGMYGTSPIWAVGADAETGILGDFTMTYDETAETLRLDEDQLIVFNASEDRMYYLSYIQTLTLYKEEPAPATIDALPYVNDFDDTPQQKHFKIIDANEDGRTWAFYSGMVRYTYSSTNAGDDWLVSPGIKLVAGKTYKFSIKAHAQQSTYPERLEVKAFAAEAVIGTDAGIEVIPATDITSASFIPLNNDEFTVETTGYYYFGVHAISDKDQYYLYVDDFVIETAPAKPDYVADFTAGDSYMADFTVIDNNGDGSTWDWSASNGAYYSYNSSNAADDYLVLPIQLEAGKNYNVTVNAAGSPTYPEKFEVVFGNQPTVEAMTTKVIEETVLNIDDFADYKGVVTVEANGMYYIAIHAISDADMFRLKVHSFAVEIGANDTAPAAVGDLTLTQTPGLKEVTVSFTAPTKQINGEYLTQNIARIDILRNGAVVKSLNNVTPGTQQKFVDAVDNNGVYKYQVVCYEDNGNPGGKSEIIPIMVKTPIDVPFAFDMFQEGVLDMFNVIDANEDGKTWTWSASNAAYYSYSSANAADDYLITLPINLKKGSFYHFSINARAYSANYAERFEVLLGTEDTPAGLTQQLIPATDVTSNSTTTYEQMFTVEEDGLYYVGVHAISDPDSWYFIVEGLSMEEISAAAPLAPTIELNVAPAGDLSATVKVTAPTNSLDGSALTENMTIVLSQDGEIVETFENVAPGSAVRYFAEPAAPATLSFQAVASTTAGTGAKSEIVSGFIGTDQPLAPEEFNIADNSADGQSLNFSWSAVSESMNGGYINPATTNYSVWTLTEETDPFWGFTSYYYNQKLVDVTGELSGTGAFNVDEGDQTGTYFVLHATNEFSAPIVAGSGLTDNYVANSLLVGKPYDLPMQEGFTGSYLHYFWSSNGTMYVSSESADGDDTALDLLAEGAGPVQFISGKINIKDVANPTLTFYVKSPSLKNVYVFGVVDGQLVEQPLAAVNLTTRYQLVKVPLASLNTGRYAQVLFYAEYSEGYSLDEQGYLADPGDELIIDDIRVLDLFQYNLAIDVATPASVTVGNAANIVATVENLGENAAQNYTVTIKAGNTELLSETATKKLSMYGKKEFTVSMPTTVFDEIGDVAITAEVSFENELVPEDNIAEGIITLTAPTVPAPENLVAKDNGQTGVDLEWTAPDTSNTLLTENFQSYENGANDTAGDWTFVNNNNYTKGSLFQDLELANDGQAKAWQVFKPTEYGISNSSFAGPNGSLNEAYLISTYNVDGQSFVDNDDWIISPEMTGDAQTISFYVNALDTQYGPSAYEVLVSSTDKEIASFTKVAEASLTTAGWQQVTADLPEGTKYFAIRNVTDGESALCLCVGDITYFAAGAPVSKFNIYFLGELIANVEGDVTTFLVPSDKLTAGKRMSFDVTAVYASGAESLPATALVEVITVTGIDQITVDGKPVDVYTLDGKLLRSQATSLAGLKGIYVINGKKYLVK